MFGACVPPCQRSARALPGRSPFSSDTRACFQHPWHHACSTLGNFRDSAFCGRTDIPSIPPTASGGLSLPTRHSRRFSRKTSKYTAHDSSTSDHATRPLRRGIAQVRWRVYPFSAQIAEPNYKAHPAPTIGRPSLHVGCR